MFHKNFVQQLLYKILCTLKVHILMWYYNRFIKQQGFIFRFDYLLSTILVDKTHREICALLFWKCLSKLAHRCPTLTAGLQCSFKGYARYAAPCMYFNGKIWHKSNKRNWVFCTQWIKCRVLQTRSQIYTQQFLCWTAVIAIVDFCKFDPPIYAVYECL